MDLDKFIITIFCVVDDSMQEILNGKRLRQRGPMPLLLDSEVITMEVVGEFLQICQDKMLYWYFKTHYRDFFPVLGKVHRTTFTRQAANLSKIKEKMWQHILDFVEHDFYITIVDSFPVQVCQFARSSRCQRFKGEATFGKDRMIGQTFYGFRLHVCISTDGLITRFDIAPGNEQDIRIVPELFEGIKGFGIGDRNYWAPILTEELLSEAIAFGAPYKRASSDPWPERSKYLNHIRHIIETVFSQLTERYHMKKVWARDTWHLGNRFIRKALSHTLAFLLNKELGNPPLQFEKLLA